MKNKKILYLYTGDHIIHRKFAKSIGADITKLSWHIPKGYDIYFTEASYIKTTIMKKLGKINKKCRLINIFADPRLYYLYNKFYFNDKKNKIKKYPFLKRAVSIYLLKKLDGVLCVGNFVKNYFQKFNKKTPIKIVYSFVSSKMIKKLKKITPNLQSKNIIFVGNGPDFNYKGLDLLICIFKKLLIKYPELKLYILGQWDIKKEWKYKNIYFTGIQHDIMPYLKNSSLMIHLGRGDTFPVSTLEAMNAGIPVLVSKDTGTKEIVSMIKKNFITELDEDEIIKKVEDYINMTKNEKEKLSNEFRKISSNFNEKKQLKEFKLKFQELIDEIELNNTPTYYHY